ncbi:hypothetical protein HYH03_004273 [Edaphochlamys debaryana]|uniref:ABC1 atypical kinase-like domain-containing protein n=1 Tax=Edaphochlamys debaryana TaxID=47281 RepID=A0A835Y837_9CHLO|nr:hypothetical protein HYH03_004273 [Edaphochlamys debaryana]|eukprot:KAG2498015.1 hypothetical protein HYH03_004273 [Edaphochlamys debaryana]
MSWLAPKQLEDASRVLRGLALVAARMATDSNLVRRAAASDYQKAMQYVADVLHNEAAHVQDAAAAASAAARGDAAATPAAESAAGSHHHPPPAGAGEPSAVAPGTPNPSHSPGFASTSSPTSSSTREASASTSAASASVPGSGFPRPGPLGGLPLPSTLPRLDDALASVAAAAATAAGSAPSFAVEGLARAAAAAAAAGRGLAPEPPFAAAPPPSPPPPPPPPASSPAASTTQPAAEAATAPLHPPPAPAAAAAEAQAQAAAPSPAPPASHEPPSASPSPQHTPTFTTTAPEPAPTSAAAAAEPTAAPLAAAAGPLDVPPPSARLPSVHDDVVVAAIAGPGAGPALGAEGQRPDLASAQAAMEAEAEGGAGAGVGAEAGAAAGAGQQARTEEVSAVGAAEQAVEGAGAAKAMPATPPPPPPRTRKLRERRVPESPIGRALGFAGLGASLVLGSLSDNVSRVLRGPPPEAAAGAARAGGGGGNAFLTEANAERLANALCRMRGAALKIGQMLSIQDESVLPPQVQAALERVRAGADVMPRSQLEGVLAAELGADWGSRLAEFEWEPRAAASIGQVHTAVLHDGRRVAMKIQYPGVARSIESDVDNLMRLIAVANILPRGMYVENAVKVAKRELALECDYTYEAACQARYRDLIAADPSLAAHFHVPAVVPALSSRRVLTTEWVAGVPIDKVCELSQEVRDRVGSRLLRLTLCELFEWKFMQTDPNWGNFLYDIEADRLNLIDFGASKEYPESFVMDYLRMVAACAERDGQGVVEMSTRLGFLTGDESPVMMDAHTQAGFVVGVPFASPGLYDFGSHGGMTARVSELGAVMLKHRLTAPPDEAYSLHRHLSGAFLACMKLKARVPCRELFVRTYESRLGPFVPPRIADLPPVQPEAAEASAP